MNRLHRMADRTGVAFEDAVECVGPGWAPLINEVYAEMLNYPGIHLTQVKEKFGRLRIYWDYPEGKKEEGSRLIPFADFIFAVEAKSGNICELCGKTGKVKSNNRGWLLARCPEHEQHEI